MYHISDIKKFLRCERLYYLGKSNNIFKPYLRSDENIVDLLINFFDIDNYYLGIKNDLEDRFLQSINDYDWFIHPRLSDGLLRINIPLLHKLDKEFDAYFLYYGTNIKDLDTLTYSISIDVLKKKGIVLNNIYLIYLNKDYVNEGTLDEKKLFLVTDQFNDVRIIDYLQNKSIDYQQVIERMESSDLTSTVVVKSRTCKQLGVCEYYYDCFPEEKLLPDDSILTLVSSKNKNRMYKSGIVHLKDVDLNQIEGNRVQYAQIKASRNGGLYFDRFALKNWLNKLSERPISFVDFEWDRYLIPAYKNMKPMDVLCFEFALYYLDESGNLQHRTFIGTGDCRKDFVEGLINYLPEKGPILAYNATGAECLRLKELAEIYPEYKDKLESIISRFKDLAIPFSEGLIYDIRMKGDFSLKRLVDICSDYSYKNLEIDDGMQAVFNWRNLDKNIEENDEKILADLKEYCSLDAYGLFLVYKWLVELVVKSNK